MLSSLVALVLAPKFPLTIESIMRGPALVGHAPTGLRWSSDGSELRFSWAKATGKGEPSYEQYVVNRDGTGLAPGSGKAPAAPPYERGVRIGDQTAYELDGDLYLYDYAQNSTKQLTKTSEFESRPVQTADGKGVLFLRGPNLFRLDILSGAITQLAAVNPVVTAGPVGGTILIRTPDGFRGGTLNASPSGTHASMDLSQAAQGVRRTQVPNYITGGGTPELIPGYDKVGGPQRHGQVAIFDLKTGSSVEMSPSRPGTVSALRWSPDGKHAVAWAIAEDHKDEWILGLDTATNKVSILWDEHDEAWVGGPGQGALGWLPDGSRFYFESERNGYANLLSLSPSGGTPRGIVEGKFEVSDVRLDAERRRFTFVSSEGSPFKRHVDAVAFDGGSRMKLADLSADEDAAYAISPNGKDVAVVRSTSNRPSELFVNGVQITHTPTEEWLSGPWIDPPIVMVPSTDGVVVPARIFKPQGWKRGGPAVIFVHGAGYLQNVYEGWSHYFREYMFHHYLMSRGYVVLDMDYRGSAGYGKAWRTAIYRHMGGKDLDDEVAGARWLVKEQGVAAHRIGIYGGSYGGFLTEMAMFTTPEVFAAGAALRPVSDWSLYNHGYTSDILNLPQTDAEAYKQSSPINFASGLRGALLICHGMVDTNVHFEDTVKLIEKLIELGKKNWSVAPYPVEDHAFERPSSWIDEYTRISDLFDRTIGNR